MIRSRSAVSLGLLVVLLGFLVACGARLKPTESPIPQPTTEPTEMVRIPATPVPTRTVPPTLTQVPTEIVLPTATFTPSPTPTPTPTATTTVVPESASPISAAVVSPVSTPTRGKPTPTATPEFSGHLVFQTAVGGDFYVIEVNGSGLRRITDGLDPRWSPDGKQIAFARWREPRGIWVVDGDGSNEQRVFDWSMTRWPSWAPDGARILFSRQHGGQLDEVERCFWKWCFTFPPHAQWKLGVIRLADKDLREPPSSDYSMAPDWHPDGTQLVYAGEHGLVVQTENGDVSYPITSDTRDTSPAWSPDGKQVVFTRRQHDHWEVYVVDGDGRNLGRLTDTPIRPDGELGHSASPAWSPDSQHIAFLTDRAGPWKIWVMRANGQEQRPMFPLALQGLTLEYGSIGERAISWTD